MRLQIHATNGLAASVHEVFAMLTDRVFLSAVCLATDPLEHEVSVVGSETMTRRVMPTPSVVARFAGPTMAVIDKIAWQPTSDAGGSRAGSALITVEGLPARLPGEVTLEPGGQ